MNKKKILSILFVFICVLFIGNNKVLAADYTLNVVGGYIEYIEGVELTGNPTTYTIAEGTKVNVFVTYQEGYYFDHWSYDRDVVNTSGTNSCTFKFTMPNGDVTITANNISKDKFKTIEGTDITGLDTTSFTNIDNYTKNEATFTIPKLGEINDSNKGSATASNLTFINAIYYSTDDLTTPATTIESGKSYVALLYFKLNDLETFEYSNTKKYIYKVSSTTDITDYMYGRSTSFPKNYLIGEVGTHINPTTGSMSVESGTIIHCYYKYMVMYAAFDVPSKFTIEFNSNGTVTQQIVTANDKLAKPEDPTRSGYTFGGWYTNEDCTTEYNFDDAVVSAVTLYAKWTKNEEATNTSEDDEEVDAVVTEKNPGTYDGIMTWILLGVVSMSSISLLMFLKKKNRI